MSVTLSEVKRAARAHRAPLAGESAGYLVLAIADQVLQAPRRVQVDDVQLAEDGGLRVISAQASSEEEAELSLRRTLDQLLGVASSGSAALTRASRRTATLGLAGLVRELEAALIPVNRAAARRALSRLHRETARALESGNLPADDSPAAAPALLEPAAPQQAAAPVEAPAPVEVALSASAQATPRLPVESVISEARAAGPEPLRAAPLLVPVPVIAASTDVEPHELPLDRDIVTEIDQDLETPARIAPVETVVASLLADSHLDGVVSALCDALPAPPQLVESDPMTVALAVRPLPALAAEAEPELLFDIDVELESEEPAAIQEIEAIDAVDSSAAPTVMRAIAVEPVAPANDDDSECETRALPVEALTKPEPVILRKTLRPLLETAPKPSDPAPKPSDPEPLPETPTLGTLAAALPILDATQIAEMTVAAELARDLASLAEASSDHTERMPEAAPLPPGVSMLESKKSDVNELLASFQVAEPDVNVNQGLCRAIKEMAELDLTPAPFVALIR